MPPLYGFLGQDAVAFLSGFRWPRPAGGRPGAWVRAGEDAPPDVVRGVPVEQLLWWLDDELWELEVEGALVPAGRAIAADRARLVRRVDTWTPELALELVATCAERVRAHGLDEYADDIGLYTAAERPAVGAGLAAYVAAHALAGGDTDAADYDAAFEREREWQVEWLRRRLRLEAPTSAQSRGRPASTGSSSR